MFLRPAHILFFIFSLLAIGSPAVAAKISCKDAFAKFTRYVARPYRRYIGSRVVGEYSPIFHGQNEATRLGMVGRFVQDVMNPLIREVLPILDYQSSYLQKHFPQLASVTNGPVRDIFLKLWSDRKYEPTKAEEALLRKYDSYWNFYKQKTYMEKRPVWTAFQEGAWQYRHATSLLVFALALNQLFQQLSDPSGGFVSSQQYADDPTLQPDDDEIQFLIETYPFPHSAVRIGNRVYSYGFTHLQATPANEYVNQEMLERIRSEVAKNLNPVEQEQVRQALLQGETVPRIAEEKLVAGMDDATLDKIVHGLPEDKAQQMRSTLVELRSLFQREPAAVDKKLPSEQNSARALVSWAAELFGNEGKESKLPSQLGARTIQVVEYKLTKEKVAEAKRFFESQAGKRYGNIIGVIDCNTEIAKPLGMENWLVDASPSFQNLWAAAQKSAGAKSPQRFFTISPERPDGAVAQTLRNHMMNRYDALMHLMTEPVNIPRRLAFEASVNPEERQYFDASSRKRFAEYPQIFSEYIASDPELEAFFRMAKKLALEPNSTGKTERATLLKQVAAEYLQAQVQDAEADLQDPSADRDKLMLSLFKRSALPEYRKQLEQILGGTK